MQRIVRNGELFHGEQKANSQNSGKNGLKMIVVLLFCCCISSCLKNQF